MMWLIFTSKSFCINVHEEILFSYDLMSVLNICNIEQKHATGHLKCNVHLMFPLFPENRKSKISQC